MFRRKPHRDRTTSLNPVQLLKQIKCSQYEPTFKDFFANQHGVQPTQEQTVRGLDEVNNYMNKPIDSAKLEPVLTKAQELIEDDYQWNDYTMQDRRLYQPTSREHDPLFKAAKLELACEKAARSMDPVQESARTTERRANLLGCGVDLRNTRGAPTHTAPGASH